MVDYRKYLGVPFKYGGNSIEEGFDCYNLCRAIYKEIGIDLPAYTYPDNPEASLIHQLINEGKPLFKQIEKPTPYCLVVFSLRPPYVTHIGVVLEDCIHFIHILEKRSVAKERLDNVFWSKRIRGFYEYCK